MEALRNAARGGQERFLVGLSDPTERRRFAAALASEGYVLEVGTNEQAIARLADESFDLAIMDRDLDDPAAPPDLLAASREVRPFSDIVLVASSDPSPCGEAFARGAAAVLPRPLPEVEALLRAHVKRLVGFRRARTRGLLIMNAFAGNRDELARTEPALTAELDAMVAQAQRDPAIVVMGDDELQAAAGARAQGQSPDAVVVSLEPRQRLDPRLAEVRARATGAAVVVVDGAPSVDRLRDALYGGVRAYLPRAALGLLGRVVASTAKRRQGEAIGVRLIEFLAKVGILTNHDTERTPAPHRDVDIRLIADTTMPRARTPVIPTGHEVLVVDDEAVVLTVLREALRRGGFRVTTAASAEEAIDLMQKRRFDLVLTDKNLPGASGLEVLRQARLLTPAPAIVLITGYSSYDTAVAALDIGAHDYIEKPISDVEDLRFRIRRALSRRDEQLARPRLTRTTTGSGGRILLVEAEGTRRQLLADFLGRSYQVTAAKDGDEALELIKHQPYDLVLSDRHLSGSSGVRVIEQAQRLLPHCASVLYTAYPSYESVKEAFAVGVDAYLVRPGDDLKKLGDKVAEALGARGGILLG
ncbi:MAG TPA: response regulator [Polyangia bacterium]|nr:response regulator [Polyangia bacterium]